MNRRIIMLTGAGGFVGSHLAQRLVACPEFEVITARQLKSGRLDLETPGAAARQCHLVGPDIVIHAAAMADPARCEREPELAKRVNTDATIELGRAARDTGARFLFLSTDQVFCGDNPPYAEDSIPQPIHVYGHTKASAEAALIQELDDLAILRLALVFGPSPDGRRSASDMVLTAAQEGRQLRLFDDEFRRPVDVRFVAKAIKNIAVSKGRSIVHLVGPERLSRYEFGARVVSAFGLPPATIRPVSRREYQGSPGRPADLDLSVRSSSLELGCVHSGVQACLQELALHPRPWGSPDLGG